MRGGSASCWAAGELGCHCEQSEAISRRIHLPVRIASSRFALLAMTAEGARLAMTAEGARLAMTAGGALLAMAIIPDLTS